LQLLFFQVQVTFGYKDFKKIVKVCPMPWRPVRGQDDCTVQGMPPWNSST
jgi:hypothetical protein